MKCYSWTQVTWDPSIVVLIHIVLEGRNGSDWEALWSLEQLGLKRSLQITGDVSLSGKRDIGRRLCVGMTLAEGDTNKTTSDRHRETTGLWKLLGCVWDCNILLTLLGEGITWNCFPSGLEADSRCTVWTLAQNSFTQKRKILLALSVAIGTCSYG